MSRDVRRLVDMAILGDIARYAVNVGPGRPRTIRADRRQGTLGVLPGPEHNVLLRREEARRGCCQAGEGEAHPVRQVWGRHVDCGLLWADEHIEQGTVCEVIYDRDDVCKPHVGRQALSGIRHVAGPSVRRGTLSTSITILVMSE